MKKIITTAFISITALGILAVAIGSAGTENDPLVTKSYVDANLKDIVLNDIETELENEFKSITDTKVIEFNNMKSSEQYEIDEDNAADVLANMLTSGNDTYFQDVFLNTSRIKAAEGAKIMLVSGGAKTVTSMIDLSSGGEIPAGTALVTNRLYMFPNDVASVEVTTSNAWISSDYTLIEIPTRPAVYEDYADALNSLGLFKGTDIGYELTRPASRGEAIVMLIRLLGEEDEALAYTGTHPFTDVPDWLKPYVAYAYNKQYTTGVSSTLFGSSQEVTDLQYATFILRALKYDDKAGDFDYYKAPEYLNEIEILSDSSLSEIKDSGRLYRDHLAYISFNALNANIKNQSVSLASDLISKSVFTESQYQNAKNSIN